MSTPTRRFLSTAAFSLLAIAALMSACDEESTVTPPTPVAPGRLQGAVYQQLNPEVPLAGATLSWGGLTATSAADGSYSLAPETAGADTLHVSLVGFVAESRWVELGQDDQQQSFALMPFDVTPPPAPLSFGIQSVGGEHLRLFWTAPADSSDLAGYWITKSPGDPQTQRFDIGVNEWTDFAVALDRDYSYTLASIDHSGNLSTALTQTAAVDAPPLGSALEFLPTGDYGQIPLRWTANRDADFGAYRLYRIDGQVTADSLDLLVFTSADAADTLFTDSAVTANALYSYRLYSFDAAGQAASPLPLSAARGAAQRFAGIDGAARVLVFPAASNRFLLADAFGGRLLLVDGDGITQDSLTVSASPTSFAPLPDGRLWAAATSGGDQGRLLLLDTAPLSLLREGLVDLQPGAIAWLGGDSLAVLPSLGGAPVLVDALNFLPLDTLDFLADLAAGSRLVADPDTQQLFAVETSGARRLFRVDLSGVPVLAESLALAGVTNAFQRDGAGNLLLAFLNMSTLLRIAEADFTQQTSIALPEIMSLGRFTADGGEWWGRPSGQTRASGYSLDWSGAAATFLVAYLQVDVPLAVGRLEPGGALVTLLDSDWVSLCDPARGDAP